MNGNEELHDIVRQLKTELEWAARTGIIVEERKKAPSAEREKPSASLGHKPLATELSPENQVRVPNETAASQCPSCKRSFQSQMTIEGTGNENAELIFIGEGMGPNQDSSRDPFVGPAGQLLNKIIAAMGIDRKDIFFANCNSEAFFQDSSHKSGDPGVCICLVKERLASISPKVIVCLGQFVSQTLLETKNPISQLRGQWKQFAGIDVIPTFHPAYLLRSPDQKRPVWEDMQAVVKRLGRELPKRS